MNYQKEPLYELSKLSTMFYSSLDPEVILEVCKYGFPKEHIADSLHRNLANHCAATYYLMDHDPLKFG
jgi:hypothetical protein